MKALAFFLLFSPAIWAIPASEAGAHVGELTEVCGVVSGVHQASRAKGKPTFLNLGKPYPNQEFTLMVWDSNMPAFGDLARYSGKQVCAFGVIKRYRGAPEMILNGPSDLKEPKN
jgi:hypothetical protein